MSEVLEEGVVSASRESTAGQRSAGWGLAWYAKLGMYLLLAATLSTVAVAYAAPEVMEPIATSLPSWVPGVDAVPLGSDGQC